MQHSPAEIKSRLLNALDQDNNVIDIPAVIEIIGVLEKMHITKEILESTRIGRYVNELRKRTENRNLAKRAKDLVRKWRALIEPTSLNNGSPLTTASSLRMMTTTAVGSQSDLNTIPVAGVVLTTVISPMNSLSSSESTSPCLPRPDSSYLLSVNCSKTVSPGPGRPSFSEHTHTNNTCCISTSPRIKFGKRPLTHSPEIVNRLCPSNKRLRKDNDELDISVIPLASLNHVVLYNGLEDSHSSLHSVDEGSRDSCGSIQSDSQLLMTDKKLHSKYRSSHLKQNHDLLKEQFASLAGRSSKIKTTKEIVAELAQSSGSQSLAVIAEQLPEPKTESTTLISSNGMLDKDYNEIKKNKSELMEKFLQSQDHSNSYEVESETVSTAVAEINKSLSPVDQEIMSILSHLPSLKSSNIVWDSDEEDSNNNHKEIYDDIVHKLHTDNFTGVNGIYDYSKIFKPWDTVVQCISYAEELLPILPYVIIE